MPKIRTVKPELFRHEALFEGETEHQLPLRLAFIGLFTCCDREGRFRWRPKQLKLDIFPYDDLDMAIVLDALVISGFVTKYMANNEAYGCIPSWDKHQYINSREPASILPICQIQKEILSESSNENQLSSHDTHIPVKNTNIVRIENNQISCEVIEANKTLNSSSNISDIFQHWKEVMKYPNANLDAKRRNAIRSALKMGYSVVQLCNAINGCAKTPHNIGHNAQSQRYDGVHLIFRDADQIDRFIHNHFHPPCMPSLQNDAEKRIQSNVQTLQKWLDKKLQQEEQ